jgi:Leucine-rich repeat (LRR) protein
MISVNTFLKKIGELPNGLKRLICDNNSLERLPPLQDTHLEVLSFSSNLVSTIPSFPSTLKQLIFNNNNVITVPNLPKNLQHLECGMNSIRELSHLPDNLIMLVCPHNFIVKLPRVSSLYFLKTIICNSNNITEIPPLPGLIEYFDYSDNPIEIFVPFPSSLIA